MKKIIAMILALTTMGGMAVSAVAKEGMAEAAVNQTNAITFAYDENGIDLSTSPLLNPGETYRFLVKVNGNDMSAEQFNSFKFRYANEAGKRMIDSIKVEKYKSQYYLTIKTKANYNLTDVEDVSYEITVNDSKGEFQNISVPALNFQVGYRTMPDSSVGDPDLVSISNDSPIVTEAQFEALNELADGREVLLAGNDWEYEVRVHGLKDTNLVYNNEEIGDIVEQYPENSFKFLNFPANPQFRANGTLRFHVSNEFDEYEGRFFVYQYQDGKLIKQNAELDPMNEILSLDTKGLGSFVITNQEITDGAVVQNNTSPADTSNTGSGVSNPDTGANDFVGLAAALAVVGAAGAAATYKKRK